jgi:putative ATPase
MKELGYGKGYQYAHDYDEAMTNQEYFPDELAGTVYYDPKGVGRESKMAEYLAKYRAYRKSSSKR